MATKETWINGLPQNTIWKPFPDTILHSSVAKRQAKFENDCISRNGHKIKITQPHLMILVSFSSAEDALSNDGLLARKVLKSAVPLFLGHPVYITFLLLWSHGWIHSHKAAL